MTMGQWDLESGEVAFPGHREDSRAQLYSVIQYLPPWTGMMINKEMGVTCVSKS